jgi:3-isopropylmalate dehydrogenase
VVASAAVNGTAPTAVRRVAVIPGDGIGPEVIAVAVRVLQTVGEIAGRRLEFVEFDWSADRYLRDGTTLPADAPAQLVQEFDAILFGALGDPRVPDNRHAAEILLGLRFRLDLYVNLRPCQLLDARLTPLRGRSEQDLNFVILRENTEGPYVGLGGVFRRAMPEELGLEVDINTARGAERILRYGFDYARRNGLKRLCMTDKSNAMPHGHGLWQRVFQRLRTEYADIEARHLYVDTLAAELVRDPGQFQVIVAPNLLGDILSDLGAQLVGGLGLAPSANLHPGRIGLYEPVHGSAPSLAGRNLANPMGAVLSSALLVEDFGWRREARAIRDVVQTAIRTGQTTPDLGGSQGTQQVGDWLCNELIRRGLPED